MPEVYKKTGPVESRPQVRGMIAMHRYQRRFKRKQDALYHGLRDSLLSGFPGPGERLPSSRQLAEQLGLSRGTVVLAFEMLESEGLIRTEQGRAPRAAARPQKKAAERLAAFLPSAWARRLPPSREHAGVSNALDFSAGHSDPALFPHLEWRAALHRAMREYNPAEPLPVGGHPALRQAVASHVMRRRGMRVHADQVVIVNGSIQAITILSHLLLDRGVNAVLENPGYPGIHDSIRLAGGRPVLADVDEHGIQIRDWQARICFVTPARQFPTGAALSYERRNDLVSWAKKRRGIIVEDDYDSEFRRRGRPLEPLQVLSPARVVHTGTFSRTLAAGLRLGYVILPENLVEPFLRARSSFETHAPGALEQSALAELMRTGAYERHLRRAGREYARRHELLIELAAEHLPPAVLADSETGLHAFAWWKGSARSLARFEELCRQEQILPGSTKRNFFARYSPSMIFSIAHLSQQRIGQGLREMGKILKAIEM